jgi:16S rRNA (cytosine967-C5)-methyltransferase
VRDALRLGLLQLLWLDSVPARAAVDQTVELVKSASPRAAGFANAVMRRAAREARSLVDSLPDDSPVLLSHPDWLADMWRSSLGPADAALLMRRDNEPAESALRVNELRTTRDELLRALGERGAEARPAPDLPEGVVVDGAFDAHGSDLFERGLLMPQSRGSMLVGRLVDPRPRERVLDLCAAPGAKSTHLAALMRGEGEVVAVEEQVPPGGTLVYSICTISPPEGPEQVERLLADDPGLELAGEPIQLLPHIEGTDGFFIARMRRAGG